MKFLLVDDNKGTRDLLKTILGAEGNEFQECDDGKYAEKIYASFIPDFVLMDLKMNEIDGFTATKEILKNFPQAKIIIVTNYAENEFVFEAEKIGALKLLSKENLLMLPELITRYTLIK